MKTKPNEIKPAMTIKADSLIACFVVKAAQETRWMREHAKQCEYSAAHNCGVRREVWLHAALMTQEHIKL